MVSMFFVACVPQHEHTYDENWTYDEEFHWHVATCEHTNEIIDNAEHQMQDNVCIVCGYRVTGPELEIGSFKENSWIDLFDSWADEAISYKIVGPGIDEYLLEFSEGVLHEFKDSEEIYVDFSENTAYCYSKVEGNWEKSELQCSSFDEYLQKGLPNLIEIIAHCENNFDLLTYDENANMFGLKFDSCNFGKDYYGVSINIVVEHYLLKSIECKFYDNIQLNENELCTATISFENITVNLPHVASVGLGYELIIDGEEEYFAVKGRGTCEDDIIVIPAYHEGKEVRLIASSAFEETNISGIVLSDSVIEIGDYAFKNCKSLGYVYLGRNLKVIGEEAFAYSEERSEIHMFDNIKVIKNGAFSHTTGYAVYGYFYFYGDINKFAMIDFQGEESSPLDNRMLHINGELPTLITIDTATYISDRAFNPINGAKPDYYIGKQVEKIGVNAINGFDWGLVDGTDTPYNVYYEGTIDEFLNIQFGEGDLWAVAESGYNLYCGNQLVEEVVFPDGIIEIPDGILGHCFSVKRIIIPDSVKIIGSYAFTDCPLESIVLPSGLEKMEFNAFEPDYRWGKFPSGFNVYEDGYYLPSEINPYFALIRSNSSIIHPDTKIIGTHAFSKQSGPTIVLPEGLCYIEDYAFSWGQVEELYIPQSVLRIGEGIFYDASENLKTLTIPFIGPTVDEPRTLSYIRGDMFGPRNLEKLVLTASCSEIVQEACLGLANLKEVSLPFSIKSIGDKAFSNCTSLTTINFPAGLKFIGDNAFLGCKNLEVVKISEGLEKIGQGAFRQCLSLKIVELPSSVEFIGEGAFEDLEKLEEVVIPFVGKYVDAQGDEGRFVTIFGYTCESLTKLTVLSGTVLVDNALNQLPMNTLVLPDTIITVGEAALWGCKNLTAVSLPNVRKIGNQAFGGCDSLINAYLPCAIEIGNFAFSGCDNLVSVYLPRVVTIGYDAFSDCEKLSHLELGNELEEIREYAFENCNSLTEINLPASVKILNFCSLCINAESVTVNFDGEMSLLNGEIEWAKIAVGRSTAKSFKFECIDGIIWVIGGPVE